MAAPSVQDSDTAQGSSVTSLTSKSFTWAAGDMFFVGTVCRDSTDAVSSVTTTGSNMTFADSAEGEIVQSRTRLSVYVGTVTGSGSGTITSNSAGTWDTAIMMIVQLRSSTGTIAADDTGSGSANDTTPTCSITTVNTDNRVLGFVGWSAGAATFTAGSSGPGYSVLVTQATEGAGGNVSEFVVEDGVQTTAATITVDGALSPGRNWSMIAVSAYETGGGGAEEETRYPLVPAIMAHDHFNGGSVLNN